MKVYGDAKSGNCYKVKLLAALLSIEYTWIDVDILAKETQSAAFKAMNPNAKIPVLVLDDGRCLWESNAIVCYLATGTSFLPNDPYLNAQTLQWQFFEQYSHEPYIAVARFIAKYLGLPDDRKADYVSKQVGGLAALQVMESHLCDRLFFVGDALSVADISLYAYTHVAHEGGFDLASFPAVCAWLTRVASQSGYVDMED
ncbi:MAG: glutathione S-transferase family protein [Congregibacter sp.]